MAQMPSFANKASSWDSYWCLQGEVRGSIAAYSLGSAESTAYVGGVPDNISASVGGLGN